MLKNIISKNIFITLIGIIIFNLFSFDQALAYRTEQLSGTVSKPTITLARGKDEITLNPGETSTKEIIFTNELGYQSDFKVEVEDFIGSMDPSKPTVFISDPNNPYSLKNYIKPEVMEFTLKNMERIYLPVTISIPIGAKPGGLYGSVAISPTSAPNQKGGPKSEQDVNLSIGFIPRLAHLFLIKINGKVDENGKLNDFNTKNKLYEKGPVDLNILFENHSNIHLDPYGTITIKNMLGATVEKIVQQPFFTLPNSLKKKTIEFDKKMLFGKYTAEIKLNRGYREKADVVDTMIITFWVLPWKILLVAFFVLVILIWLIARTLSKFKIVKVQ